ncbi:hypothetical protein [Haloferula sp. BvORR071]|uniref:hypothetical protein n=1 Tax=Haloferula sp. BvORR071 TaxID=1396141 RepID=UPI0005514AF6|nr:hypothetical protein [Haloferula sp. BvORR071]
MVHGVVSPADGMAMSMVVILVLSLGVVALLLTIIRRSGRRAETEVEKLLEELRRDEEAERHPAPPSGSAESREPWEREEDWWKK